ncbi:MAG: DinB family protein [Lewinellaceae bacterium]|nr:DinB family protein [Saprospiraceae bacterium]MCB9336814.1 DinB family protein [Lewinellaceae bacterium]
MFDYRTIARELERNKAVFQQLLENKTAAEYRWRPAPDKWSLLEIVGHLYDEEREDFKARVHHVLENPKLPLPPINPVGWVAERDYAGQDYGATLAKFLTERKESVLWLRSLVSPNWENTCHHPTLGAMSAKKFLANWLAHDYLHIRQINRYNFQYFQQQAQEDLSYAGDWQVGGTIK